MKKRSKSLQSAIDTLNQILANKEVFVGQLEPSSSIKGCAFKQGVAEALEVLLHKTDTYRGFSYLEPTRPNLEWERKYY